MAQENYAACVAFVRKQEGGNCATPGDRGGRTGRGGITHTTYDAYRATKGLPAQDVWQISDAEIADIYRTNYWAPIYGDRLPAGQDLAIFDYAINSGPAKANQARLLAGTGDTPALIRKICDGRLSFMHALVSWNKFGKAWGRRVAECEALSLHMAGALTPAVPAAAAEALDARKKQTARRVVAGGAAAGGGLHFLEHAGLWALAGIISLSIAAVAIAAFNAWRQGQRVDALTSAVTNMRAAQMAAMAARDAASAQVDAKEIAIAAEQAALAAAKAAIGSMPAIPAAQPPGAAAK